MPETSICPTCDRLSDEYREAEAEYSRLLGPDSWHPDGLRAREGARRLYQHARRKYINHILSAHQLTLPF